MKKVPSAKSIREARLNLVEALAHLDVATKAIRSKNPLKTPAKKTERVKKGRKLYKGFRVQHSKGVREYSLDVNVYENTQRYYLGQLSAIEYTTVRAGETERYRHEFSAMAMPTVYRIGNSYELIRSVVGRYKFGKRGFVDSTRYSDNNPEKPDYSVLVEVGTLDAYELSVGSVSNIALLSAGKVIGRKRVRMSIAPKNRPILAVTESGTAIYTLKK